MQAKCLAQLLAHSQHSVTEAMLLLAVVVRSWQQIGPSPEGGGPAHRDSQQSPLLSASANTETSNDQAPGPCSISCPPCAGRKEDQKTG